MPRIDLDRAGWPNLTDTALFAASRVLGLSHPAVGDVAQEAMVRALEHADRFDPLIAPAEAWVTVIARHLAISVLRQQRPWLRLGGSFEEGEIDLADPLALEVPDQVRLAEELDLAFADLARIPVRPRILFILVRDLRPLEGRDERRDFKACFGLPYEVALSDPGWWDCTRAELAARAGMEYEALNQTLHRVQERLVELAARRMRPPS